MTETESREPTKWTRVMLRVLVADGCGSGKVVVVVMVMVVVVEMVVVLEGGVSQTDKFPP